MLNAFIQITRTRLCEYPNALSRKTNQLLMHEITTSINRKWLTKSKRGSIRNVISIPKRITLTLNLEIHIELISILKSYSAGNEDPLMSPEPISSATLGPQPHITS